MLKTKALRKIFITTLSLFILLTFYSIPNTLDQNILKTNLEIEDISGLSTNNVYLLNENGFLVKSRVLIDSSEKIEQIKKMINHMILNKTNSLPNGLNSTIPRDTEIIDVIYGEKLATINFSKELLNVDSEVEKQMISSIVYSIMDLGGIEGVSILVDGNYLEQYPNCGEKLEKILTKENVGINKSYNLNSRDNISKVVIYYVEEIYGEVYYVPVTKYINDDREKIKIIVEELSSSYIYEPNLMSFLNSNVELLGYEEEGNVMFLNFNDYLFDGNDKLLEEVIYSISYSVFENYDVNMVMFEVNGEKVKYISSNDLP